MSITELKNESIKKTRKQHQCCWCAEVIEKGEEAQYRSYIFEELKSDYMHPECYQAMLDKPKDWYFDEEGWMPGDFKRGSYEER